MKTIKVERTELYSGQDFPLIRLAVYTGEALNPWRCECCLTKPQRKAAEAAPTVDKWDSLRTHHTAPECCRKCGLTF